MSLFRVVAGLVGSLGVLAGVCGAAAAHGGVYSDRLDVFTHFTPFWLVFAGLGGAIAMLSTRGAWRGMMLGLAAAGVGLSAALIAPELLRDAGEGRVPPGAPQIKLIQMNTWSGRNLDIPGTIDWLLAQDADVIVLEEVKQPMRKALKARAEGYHLSCERWSRCEVMILSKRKPLAAGIPYETVGSSLPVATATLPAPGKLRGGYAVFGAHYTWPYPAGLQQQQGVRLAALMDHYPKDRMILAGDFNSTPWSFTRRRQDARFALIRRTRALFSWPTRLPSDRIPSPIPFLPIDHVFAGPAWTTVSVERGPRLGSDHYPVIVKLALTR